jgi:hypothetical protein
VCFATNMSASWNVIDYMHPLKRLAAAQQGFQAG